MIRLTREQFEELRKGKRLEVPCPRRQREGRAYLVLVAEVVDGNGEVVHPRCKRTVTIMQKTSDVTAILGWSDQTDTPNLLAAHSERGYTSEPYQAMPDEPEAIPPALQEQYSKQAEARRKLGYGRVGEIERELDTIQASIDRLRARDDLGRQGAKRLADMKRSRDALLRDLAA